MANQQASPTDGKRNAQPVITNAPTGPQRSLVQDPFSFAQYRFPLNLGENPRNLHYIKFTPCIQEKSSYQVKTTGLSQADKSRAAGASGLAGKTDPFGAVTGAAVSGILGSIGAAEAVIDNAGTAVQAALGNKAALGEIAGESIKGGAGGLIAGAIVTAIDLSRKTRRAASSICLYMPDTVTNQLVNDYDAVSLTAALGRAGLAAQGVNAVGTSVLESVTNKLQGSKPSFGLGGGGTSGTGAGFGAEIGGAIAEKTGQFGAGITDVLLFSAGLAQNPQVELLFKNIQNREFLFDFKFAPRNAKEAAVIRNIIKEFRFHAAPEIPNNASGRYFIPPSEFDIEFMIGKLPNNNLPKISTCVLQGIDVNYGSAGQWTAFQDGMPVEISMQLRFKEVEIMHKKLIKDGY